MTKINSKYIKDNVKCVHCQQGGNKLKRTHKQSFKSPMNSELELKPEKFEWRQFSCDCGYDTNVLNTENKLLSVTEEAVIPFSGFDFYFQIAEELSLWMFYKETVNGQVIEDNIEDRMIFNFNKLFKKHHIVADNVMENCWEITFDNFYYTIKNAEDAIDKVKNILLEAGATYDQGMAIEEENPQAFILENIYTPETEAKILQRKVDKF